MKKIAIGLSVATLALAGTAVAQGMRPNMDADGNDVITRAEAQAAATAAFARMDVNKDGKIDQSDRDARMQDHKADMFAALDTDKNGQISREEFMSHERPDRPGGREGWKGDRKDGDRKGRGHHGPMMMGKMADTNNDGVITQAEFSAASDKHFAMMDANNDGQVTKEEQQAAREKMKAQWRDKRGNAPDGN